MKRLLQEAARMIRIHSVTGDGNEELANYVAALMKQGGLKVQMQQVMHSLENISKRQFNVIGVLGDSLVDKKTYKGLLLNTHLDTVGPGRLENWTETGGDPFSAVVKDGKIFGLGSADVKLDFLCKLRAIEKYREKKLKMPIYLVGTAAEEVGMLGAKYLIKSMALNPKYVVVGEPSELKVVYAHKSLSTFKVSIGFQLIERDARGFNRRISLHSFGKSAHSSYPHLGQNAISQMLDFLRLASESGFDLRYTRLAGGEVINKVPDHSLAEFYLSSHQFEDFKRFFKEVAERGAEFSPFKVELGGLGETGVRFLPEALFQAIMDVVGFFNRLTDELKETVDSTYSPPYSTVNFGLLSQGLGRVDLLFDLRTLPEVSPEEIEGKITQGIRAIAAHYLTLNISASREQMSPGLGMTLEHELVRLCQSAMDAAGLQGGFQKKATSTEAAQYFRAGYEAVVFGPGISQGNSHSPNEHNLLDHLEKAVSFYEKLIEKVCL